MTTIKELQKLDFKKIGSDALEKEIRKLIKSHEQAKDKAYFIEMNQGFMDKFKELVKKNYPDALKGTAKASPKEALDPMRESTVKLVKKLKQLKGKTNHSGLADAIEELEGILAEEPDDDLFKHGLENAVNAHQLRDLNEVSERVEEAFETARNHPEKQQKKGNPASLRAVVRHELEILTSLEIDVDREDATIIGTTRINLEKALNEGDDKSFRVKAQNAIAKFKNWELDISDESTQKDAIDSMNRIEGALKETSTPTKTSPDRQKTDRQKSKAIEKELEAMEVDLEACRMAIREHNKKKREAQEPKPKKTRYTKLKEKLLAIIGLMPEKLKNNIEVQHKTEAILLRTHKDLVEAWEMNKIKARPGADAIEEKFEAMEEKLAGEVKSYCITSLKEGGMGVTTQYKDDNKETIKLSKATIDWVNEHHEGSFDKVGAKRLLQKEASLQKQKTEKAKTKPKDSQLMVVEFEYRNAGNYKTHFTHEVDLGKYPKAKNLKVGDEITMGTYGTLPESEFFNSEIHEYNYDPEDDHDLLEVVKIIKD